MTEACRDAFIITGGLIVISPCFRDVRTAFDLGQTQLFGVPIYQDEAGTPSPYPSHYLLHLMELRDCLVPEASENVQKFLAWGATEPEPDAPWVPVYDEDKLALRAGSVHGVDLWADPNLRRRLFFSDRLKRALDAAELTPKGWKLVEAKLVS
ncbi:MAG: DUF1629 domain-containing protein [Pseudomonadota bacterium]